MDIRKLTRLVIRKDGKYLVGAILGTRELRWSDSCYDAWRTREMEKARKAARITGGTMMLFNPAAGQLREMK